MNWLLGDSSLFNLKNILSIFEDINALNEKFNEVGVGGQFALVVIGLCIVISVVFFIAKLVFENTSLTSFDIKLFPKKNHARFIFGKSISTFIITTILLFIAGLLISLLISQIIFFEYVTVVILLLVLTLYVCAVLLTVLYWFFHALKFAFFKFFRKDSDFQLPSNPILGLIRKKFPKLLEIVVMSVLFLFGSFHLFLLSDSDYLADSIILNIIFTLFIFAIQSLYLIYILFPKSRETFTLYEVSNEMPTYDLILDYYIDDSTSVLHNRDGSKKVIKKLVGEKYIYEIYNVTNE